MVVRHLRYGRVEKWRDGLGFVSKPALRFLIERNVRISRIALSDWLHVRPTAGVIDRGKRSRRMRPSSPYTRSMQNRAVPRPGIPPNRFVTGPIQIK
jgi:hypothetical protein